MLQNIPQNVKKKMLFMQLSEHTLITLLKSLCLSKTLNPLNIFILLLLLYAVHSEFY